MGSKESSPCSLGTNGIAAPRAGRRVEVCPAQVRSGDLSRSLWSLGKCVNCDRTPGVVSPQVKVSVFFNVILQYYAFMVTFAKMNSLFYDFVVFLSIKMSI